MSEHPAPVPVMDYTVGHGDVTALQDDGVDTHPLVALQVNGDLLLVFDAHGVPQLAGALFREHLAVLPHGAEDQPDPYRQMLDAVVELRDATDELDRTEAQLAKADRWFLLFWVGMIVLALSAAPWLGWAWLAWSVQLWLMATGLSVIISRAVIATKRWRTKRKASE